MTLASSFALIIAMFVLALTPGPGVFISISAGLQETPKRIAAMISGIITGDILFLMLSIYGLSWVATHLQGAFLFLQYGGAAYLCYMGFIMLKHRNETSIDLAQNGNQASATGRRQLGYMVGLVVTLANPKVIFFYVSFLPNFMDLQSLTALDIFIVIFIIAAVLATSMGFYAWLAYSARHAVVSEAAQKTLNTTSGALILVTGVIFALKTG